MEGKTGADLFIVHMGTNTSEKGEKVLPDWNSFKSEDVSHVEVMARTILSPEGVLVILHGNSLVSSMCIHDCFRGEGVNHWANPKTFTVWNDTARYIKKGTKQVSQIVVFCFAQSRLSSPRFTVFFLAESQLSSPRF